MTHSSSIAVKQFPEITRKLAAAIGQAGGRAWVVGGFIRDELAGRESKDYDLEVYGLTMDQLEKVLSEFGQVIAVGKAFGVLRVKGLDMDFSVPRRDNKVGKGHTGFRMEFDPDMSFEEAARRRDLTINSMGADPLTGEIVDPHGGQKDLAANCLRATDEDTFAEDPLRALRVAQFMARFQMKPDAKLIDICSKLDLSELSAERIWDEFERLFLLGQKPSLGLEFLRTTNLVRFFPELESLIDTPQDKEWHPEGDVWVHTLMVVNEAAALRQGDRAEDLLLMYGALCHDLGKPQTTYTDDQGRVRSPAHESEGEHPTRTFMDRIRAPHHLVEQVVMVVRHHLAPFHFLKGQAKGRAYRRLAHKLDSVGLTLHHLERVARADHFGRTVPEAIAHEFPAGDLFIEKAHGLHVDEGGEPDVVKGRHLIARGLTPGHHFGIILKACRDIQDDEGWQDPEQILNRAIKELEDKETL